MFRGSLKKANRSSEDQYGLRDILLKVCACVARWNKVHLSGRCVRHKAMAVFLLWLDLMWAESFSVWRRSTCCFYTWRETEGKHLIPVILEWRWMDLKKWVGILWEKLFHSLSCWLFDDFLNFIYSPLCPLNVTLHPYDGYTWKLLA